MANTLTNLIPDVYTALDVVSREMTGFIPAVQRDSKAESAAKDETIRISVSPATNASDLTPAMSIPSAADQTIGNVNLTMDKMRHADFSWNGEEIVSMDNGIGYLTIQQDQIAQALRTLVNEIESDIAALHIHAARAYGTAGTTPFGTVNDYTDASNVNKILLDNGAPISDKHLIIDTAAGANIRGKQAGVNQAGTDSILRQGVLLDINGMAVRESAQINTSTAGTGASATTNAAGYAVGATVITLASAGTGTIVAGDVITFAGDTEKYVVESGDTNVADGGSITLAEPGLRTAITTSATAITVIAAAARNMAFTRNAILLATRLPAQPPGGDLADDRTTITDPRSGLSFDLSTYAGQNMRLWRLSALWGVKMIKAEHCAVLLG